MPAFKVIFGLGTVGLASFTALSLAKNCEWTYKYVAMPTLSLIDPERSHRLAVWLASKGISPKEKGQDPVCLVRDLDF